MLANTSRDRPLVPAMRRAAEAFGRFYEAAADVADPRTARAGRAAPPRAGRDRHALAFETWRSLVESRVSPSSEAVELMSELVRSAAATR